MLTVSCISKSFGIQPILKNISFSVNLSDRLGLIGANGCGKTTLLRIIVGLDKPDGGKVSLSPESLKVGYLPQGFNCFDEQTVGQYLDAISGNQEELNTHLEALAMRLSQNPEDRVLQNHYDEVLSLLITAGENNSRAESVLPALGLAGIPRSQSTATLSGGQKTRLALASVLISAPQLVILDEPTNHLDITMLTWLEEWLLNQHGAMLLVSHDRQFLDRTSNGILELDSQTHTLKSYPGNYSDYLADKQMELDHQWQQYSDQQGEIKRLKRASERVRSRAQHTSGGKLDDNDKFGKGFFNNRTLEIMRRSKGIEKRVEHMLTDEKIDKPSSNWQMKIGFENVQPTGRDVLVMEDLVIGFESKNTLLRLNTSIRNGSRVALVGENGSGKTTLLRTLMGLILPLAGRYRFGSQVKPGYMAQEGQEASFKEDAFSTISHLTPYSETEVRRFLSYYLFTGDEVFIPADHLSFGEKARLSLAGLVASGCNFLLLDEPTNHLDIPSRVRFEEALENFTGTALVISHDRYFIEQFATEVWEIEDHRIRVNL